MKVKISFKRTLYLWLVALVIGGAFIFLAFFKTFTAPWEAIQPIVIAIYLALMVSLLLISFNSNYYYINKKDLTMVKFKKEYIFFYSDIIYIDQKEMEKGKVITFVTNKGIVRYINQDEKGLVAKALMKKCTNLMELEDVKRKFPNIKI